LDLNKVKKKKKKRRRKGKGKEIADCRLPQMRGYINTYYLRKSIPKPNPMIF